MCLYQDFFLDCLFCINEYTLSHKKSKKALVREKKEETYYRTYNGCKSTVYLILANLSIALEITCSKEYDLRGSDHFPIILRDESKIFTKQQ